MPFWSKSFRRSQGNRPSPNTSIAGRTILLKQCLNILLLTIKRRIRGCRSMPECRALAILESPKYSAKILIRFSFSKKRKLLDAFYKKKVLSTVFNPLELSHLNFSLSIFSNRVSLIKRFTIWQRVWQGVISFWQRGYLHIFTMLPLLNALYRSSKLEDVLEMPAS